MSTANLIQILYALIAGFGGYLLKALLDARSERERQRHTEKEPHYRTLILCIKSLSSGNRKDIDLFLYEFYFLWLYAPDDVIRAAREVTYRISTKGNIATQSNRTALANLLMAIRRDMGFKRTDVAERELTLPEAFAAKQ